MAIASLLLATIEVVSHFGALAACSGGLNDKRSVTKCQYKDGNSPL